MAADIHTPDRELAVHAATYHHFMLGVKWAAITLASILVFLVLGFATPAGVFSGLVGGVIVFAIGAYVMNHGLAHSTESDGPGGIVTHPH
jgi:hypothetical protein